jgi:hypothetical protein
MLPRLTPVRPRVRADLVIVIAAAKPAATASTAPPSLPKMPNLTQERERRTFACRPGLAEHGLFG